MSDADGSMRSHGQTFMAGPNIYFRAPDLDDAETAMIWRNSPFPAPVEVVRSELQKRFDKGMAADERHQLLLACRRSDDMPVGSVDMETNGWKFIELEFVVDRLLPHEEQDYLLKEMIELVVPWSIEERHAMSVGFPLPAGWERVEQRAEQLGGTRAYRARERYLVDGSRRDEQYFQFLNPVWVRKLGQPVYAEEESPQAAPVPAKPRMKLTAESRPSSAIVAGERVYLRPLAPADSERAEYLSRREVEVVFPEGRWIINAPAFRQSAVMAAEDSLPDRAYFAIVLRDSDEFIGIVGLSQIDWIHRTAETVSEIYRADFRGGGYGTESKHLLLEYAFDMLGLHMLYSYVSEINPRSAAALRKQGYRLAGSFAWESFVEDGICGSWVFDILADEWRAARNLGK